MKIIETQKGEYITPYLEEQGVIEFPETELDQIIIEMRNELFGRSIEIPTLDSEYLPFCTGTNKFPLSPDKIYLSDSLDKPSRPKYEVADIFRIYGKEYRKTHSLTKKQKDVMYNIENCRKGSAFGYHMDVCDNCGHQEISGNSCRNRHCPKCQGIARRKWVHERTKELLPVPYYHIVFTLPDEDIFPICIYNKELIYDLLFKCASETLLEFGRDPKWLGGEIGFYGILHTWGQTLCFHVHIHFVAAGGGLTEEGEWKTLPHKGKFIFPVHALSKTFRRLFTEGLERAYKKGQINIPSERKELKEVRNFNRWINKMRSKEWVVHAKKPFGSAKDVVNYVGLYTHRVAISNHRILSIENGTIKFKYKNYKNKDNCETYEELWEEMELRADEFIQRFLWHILPDGYHKIRYFGIFRNGKKAGNIKKIQDQLDNEKFLEEPEELEEDNEGEKCPICETGTMIPVFLFNQDGTILLKNVKIYKMINRETLWNSS